MCTATWLMRDDGYELFCNRDELRTRPPAEPPAVRKRNGVRYLAPRDPQAGGSWIAVNEYGLSLCLLNLYEVGAASSPRPATGDRGGDAAPPTISRGLLVTSLTDHRSPDEIARILWQHKLTDYRPFLLLILAPRLRPLLLKWDGARTASEVDPRQPVTTSSFDTARVVERRRALYVRLEAKAYHFSHDPAGGAYSVCMSRQDAQTVSFSHLVVAPDRIDFEYTPLAAEVGAASPPRPVVVTLNLRGGDAAPTSPPSS